MCFNFIFLVAGCNFSNLKEKQKYYPDGTLKKTYFVDENGKRQGKYIGYDKDGNIEEIKNYKNDTLNGIYINYVEDVKIVMKFKDGIQIDTAFQYSKKSRKLQVYTVLNKGKETKEVFFYPNGKIEEIETYFVKEGLINAYKVYSEDGMLNVQSKECKFLTLKQVGDSVQIKPFGFVTDVFDSAQIMVLKNLNDYSGVIENPKILRQNTYRRGEWVRLKLSEEDYVKGKANIMIIFYAQDSTIPKPHSQTIGQEFYVQLKQGEKLPKDNLQPIYFDE